MRGDRKGLLKGLLKSKISTVTHRAWFLWPMRGAQDTHVDASGTQTLWNGFSFYFLFLYSGSGKR